jgi:hypothetical protein
LTNALGANEQAGVEHFIDGGFSHRTTSFKVGAYVSEHPDQA